MPIIEADGLSKTYRVYQKKDGLLGKFFGGGTPKPSREFMVNVRPKADTVTEIAIVDANGQVDTSTDAQRIVALLHAQLN